MAIVLIAGVATVWAVGGTRAVLFSADANGASDEIRRAFPTFGEPPTSPDDVSRLISLRSQFADPSIDSKTAEADFSDARVVPIPGEADPAWIAPSGDSVCTFIPDPTDGYGASCVTLQDIREGHGFSFLGDRNFTYVVVLLPEGEPTPTVDSPTDPEARFEVSGNAAAAKLPSDAQITTSHSTINLAQGDGPIETAAP
ncbi:MAG: hypothetical protein QM648_01730 [Solirubrobacterales bacterium]